MATLICWTSQAPVPSPVCSSVSLNKMNLKYISIDEVVYIANVGDSRAFMSVDGGNYNVELSRDHKPNDDLEQKRIVEAGGRIYQ